MGMKTGQTELINDFSFNSPADFNKYLRMQCEIVDITYPKWAYQWMNIKRTFAEFYSTRPGRKLMRDYFSSIIF